ncbi:hypothetical protein FRAHR75_280042 [Frankia sp. Hr75.2]|nr:hypothetical protein FRAHR75_280042 [Frankia sp. Hr75.2]
MGRDRPRSEIRARHAADRSCRERVVGRVLAGREDARQRGRGQHGAPVGRGRPNGAEAARVAHRPPRLRLIRGVLPGRARPGRRRRRQHRRALAAGRPCRPAQVGAGAGRAQQDGRGGLLPARPGARPGWCRRRDPSVGSRDPQRPAPRRQGPGGAQEPRVVPVVRTRWPHAGQRQPRQHRPAVGRRRPLRRPVPGRATHRACRLGPVRAVLPGQRRAGQREHGRHRAAVVDTLTGPVLGSRRALLYQLSPADTQTIRRYRRPVRKPAPFRTGVVRCPWRECPSVKNAH